MGIIGNMLLSGESASSRPVLLPDTCLNRKQNKYTCTVCEEVCPEKILTRELTGELKWYRCTDCGLCVSACPSRCFIPSAQMQRVLTDTTHPGEAVVIACDREEELLKRKVLCLAGIPWELLAILTFFGDVVLSSRIDGDDLKVETVNGGRYVCDAWTGELLEAWPAAETATKTAPEKVSAMSDAPTGVFVAA